MFNKRFLKRFLKYSVLALVFTAVALGTMGAGAAITGGGVAAIAMYESIGVFLASTGASIAGVFGFSSISSAVGIGIASLAFGSAGLVGAATGAAVSTHLEVQRDPIARVGQKTQDLKQTIRVQEKFLTDEVSRLKQDQAKLDNLKLQVEKTGSKMGHLQEQRNVIGNIKHQIVNDAQEIEHSIDAIDKPKFTERFSSNRKPQGQSHVENLHSSRSAPAKTAQLV